MKLIQYVCQPRSVIHLKRCVMPLLIQHCNSNRTMSYKTTSSNEWDKPIPYSTSKAATWKAEYTRKPPSNSVAPNWARHVVFASVCVFLIYFSVLREENDIDIFLSKELPILQSQDIKLSQGHEKTN